MVARERHLWLNLADTGEKEKLFFSKHQCCLLNFLTPGASCISPEAGPIMSDE